MSADTSPKAAAAARRLPEILADAVTVIAPWYAGYTFVLVGYPPTGDARVELRVPCPLAPAAAAPPEPPPGRPDDESNADVILVALDEADGPLTVVELGYRATGGEPTGAFRKALRKLVRDGRVAERPGPPKTYEAV